jgi:HrpA-like RNA helicase
LRDAEIVSKKQIFLQRQDNSYRVPTLQIHQCEGKGDILIFLTGEEEKEDVCKRVRGEAEKLGEEYGPIVVVIGI